MDISVVLEAKYEKIYQALYIKVIVSEKFKVLCGTVLFSSVKFKTNISKQWKTLSIYVYSIFYFPYLTYEQQCCVRVYIYIYIYIYIYNLKLSLEFYLGMHSLTRQ